MPALRRRHFYGERNSKSTQFDLYFSNCCDNGNVVLDLPIEPLPEPINSVLYTNTAAARAARDSLRPYNMFTSMVSCSMIDVCPQGAPGNIRVHGEIKHRSGPIGPGAGKTPKFMQVYCVDTALNDSSTSDILRKLDCELLEEFRDMLRTYNPYTMLGIIASAGGTGLDANFENFDLAPGTDLSMVFKHDVGPDYDPRVRGTPVPGEVGYIIVGDITKDARDIVISRNVGPGPNVLRHIDDINPHYLPMAYPLLFPFGFLGWHLGMKVYNKKTGVPRRLTPLDLLRYLFQVRSKRDLPRSPSPPPLRA